MKKETGLLLLALSVFAVGCVYYFFIRCFTYGLTDECVADSQFFNSFPSFVHVFSFAILHCLLFKSSARYASLFWFSINALFELGQMWQGGSDVKNRIVLYFSNGQFDIFDILGAAFGALVAYLLLRFTREAKSPPQAS